MNPGTEVQILTDEPDFSLSIQNIPQIKKKAKLEYGDM